MSLVRVPLAAIACLAAGVGGWAAFGALAGSQSDIPPLAPRDEVRIEERPEVRLPTPVLHGRPARTEPACPVAVRTRQPAPARPATMDAVARLRVGPIRWDGANLDEVVASLHEATGFPFFITPRVRAEAFDDITVCWEVSDDVLFLQSVLDAVITEPYDLAWEIRDGVIVIGRTDEMGSEALQLRYLDLQDLRVAIGESWVEPPAETPWVPDPEAVMATILMRCGGRGDWDPPAGLWSRNGIVIARNRRALLDEAQALVEEIRASGPAYVWPTASGAPPRR